MVIWTNEIPTILHLFWAKKGNNRINESILEKNKVSVKAGKMIQEKRQLQQSLAQN